MADTNIANVAAIAACNAVVDLLDATGTGTTPGTIRGRTGTIPTDVDSAESGTLLFTLTCSATAFGDAADSTGSATATAAAITPDSTADASGTVGYCRCGRTSQTADDILDGDAGTGTETFVFNTASIAAGGTVSMTAFTVTMPEG